MREGPGSISPPSSTATTGLFWNLVSAGLPLVGSFLVSILIAPYLGPAGFGHYMTTMSAATLVLIVGKFGVHAATSRLVTEHEEAAGLWLRAGMAVRALFTLPVVALCVVLGPALAGALDGGELVRPFLLLGPIVLAASFFELGTEALIGLRRFRDVLGVRVSFLVLRLAAIAWVRLGQLGSTAFLTGHALAQLLPAGWLVAGLLRRYRRHPPRDGVVSAGELGPAMRRTLAISAPLALSSASFLVYAHTDRLMIARFVDQAAVGQYGVARNVLDAALFPLFALTWSLRPALVRAVAAREPATLESTLSTGFRYSFLYAVAAPALLWVFGRPLLVALYSTAYGEAGDLLTWMLPILFLRGIGTVIFPALLAADAQGTYARLMVWTALINVGANLVLIPPLGPRGAVVATVISLVPLTAGGLVQVRRRVVSYPWTRGARSHAAAVGSSAAVAWIAHRWFPREAGLTALVAGALGCTLLILAVTLGPELRRRSAP